MAIEPQLAVKSKKRGDPRDYRVLAFSAGPLGAEDFEALYKELSVGTMPTAPRHGGEGPPWITAGAVERDHVRHVAIIRQELTDRQDAHGRPFNALCALSVPYAALTELTPGYADLLANVPAQQFFLRDESSQLASCAVSFAPPAERIRSVAALIDQLGFEFCASVAALLIQGPVALMRGHDLAASERLTYVDAIVSLLPYGCRADLGVSTWIGSTSSDKIRLGFSDILLQNQQRVVWAETAAHLLKANTKSHTYYQLLLRLSARYSTQDIVTTLVAKTQPLTFAGASEIINLLSEFDRPYLLWEKAKAGHATPQEVRALFNEDDSTRLSEDKRADLLAVVLQHPTAQDVDLARRYWSSGLLPSARAAAQAAACNFTAEDETLRALGKLASETGWMEDFLLLLLQAAAAGSAPLTPVLEWVFNGLVTYEDLGERLRPVLLADRRLLYEFLLITSRRMQLKPNLEGTLAWLEAGGNGEIKSDLKIFHIIFGLLPRDASLHMIETLARQAPSFVPQLVAIAAERSRLAGNREPLQRLNEAISLWLLNKLDGLSPEQTRQWEAHLPALRESTYPSAETHARCDLLSAALSSKLSTLFLYNYLSGRARQIEIYTEEFNNHLEHTGSKRPWIIEQIIACLGGQRAGSETEVVNELYFLSGLMTHIHEERLRNNFAMLVGGRLRTYPALLAHQVFKDRLKDRLIRWSKPDALFGPLAETLKRAVARRAPVEEVAEVYAQFMQLGVLPEKMYALERLLAREYLLSSKQVEGFFDALLECAEGQAAAPGAAAERTLKFIWGLLQTDTAPLRQFRQSLAAKFMHDLKQMDAMAELVTRELSEAQIQQSASLLESLRERLPKNAPKGRAWFQKKK